MNSFPKYVMSRTLGELPWNNSTRLTGDLEKEVRVLQEQPGQDLLVFGSAQLVQSLTALDLVDQLRLQVYPLVIGRGIQLSVRPTRPAALHCATRSRWRPA
jgi:dihydrofolate reductase